MNLIAVIGLTLGTAEGKFRGTRPKLSKSLPTRGDEDRDGEEAGKGAYLPVVSDLAGDDSLELGVEVDERFMISTRRRIVGGGGEGEDSIAGDTSFGILQALFFLALLK